MLKFSGVFFAFTEMILWLIWVFCSVNW
jgi:hypothetical protein